MLQDGQIDPANDGLGESAHVVKAAQRLQSRVSIWVKTRGYQSILLCCIAHLLAIYVIGLRVNS